MFFKIIIRQFIKNLRRLRILLYRRAYISSRREKDIVRLFTKLYYDSYYFGKTWNTTSWLGIPVHKNPFDLWVYQEIIFKKRPDIIIEAGTARGGSAFFFATLCDLVGNGSVITIDTKVKNENRPKHRRISYLLGSSTDEAVVRKIKSLIGNSEKVMVVLDSRHHKWHVLNELKIYSQIVTPGQYLVVEDSCLNDHPVHHGFGPGPMEAIDEFIAGSKNFKIDREQEKHLMTFNPKGYLLKIK